MTAVRKVPVRPRPASRKKSAGRQAKMTTRQVRAAHVLYVQEGLTITELGDLLWRRFGYASARSCADCLGKRFRKDGLPMREKAEVLAAYFTKDQVVTGSPRGNVRRHGPIVTCGRRKVKGGICTRRFRARKGCPYHRARPC